MTAEEKSTAGIRLREVSAGYRGKAVLHDISLDLTPGQITVILGENGSGKTTLLKVMAGLLPYTGSVRIDGQELNTLSAGERAAQIALLSQMNSSYFSYTVEETVRMGRYRFHTGLFSGTSGEDRERVKACLDAVDLAEARDVRIGELSGGQLQRVYLARMFAQDAAWLFLDEPTNHLDLKYRARLEQELSGSHRSVVAVYHDIRAALGMADQVILLKSGSVIAAAPPNQILPSGALNEAFAMDVVSYLGL